MSLERLDSHRALWFTKPVLADIYGVWFRGLLDALPARGRVVELGAGPGFLSAFARSSRPGLAWIATDLIATGWNDAAVDALRLPFPDASLDGVAGLDLLHHLERPGIFFAEVGRVLRPGGCMALVEPWVTPLSYPIYRWLHQEDCHLGVDPWDPFKRTGGGTKDAFEGNAAIPWLLARHADRRRWVSFGLGPPRVMLVNAFAYLLSLGFRRASLLPRSLLPVALWLDTATRRLAPAFALRALLVWQRADGLDSSRSGKGSLVG